MFLYASLIGICLKKKLSLETCAVIKPPKHKNKTIIFDSFINTFYMTIPTPNCSLISGYTYKENLKAIENIKFDNNIFSIGTGAHLLGNFKSYKWDFENNKWQSVVSKDWKSYPLPIKS